MFRCACVYNKQHNKPQIKMKEILWAVSQHHFYGSYNLKFRKILSLFFIHTHLRSCSRMFKSSARFWIHKSSYIFFDHTQWHSGVKTISGSKSMSYVILLSRHPSPYSYPWYMHIIFGDWKFNKHTRSAILPTHSPLAVTSPMFSPLAKAL